MMIEPDENRDIFDKIMHLSFFKLFYPFYKKYKQVLLYIFFGALTTFVSLMTFWVFSYILKFGIIVSNTLSWVCAVLFAYITNRKWVFASEATTILAIIKEIGAFFGGRFLTYVMEDVILFGFVVLLKMNKMGVKVVATVIVMILNYIISKWFVF